MTADAYLQQIPNWLWGYVAFIAIAFVWLTAAFSLAKRRLAASTDSLLTVLSSLGAADDTDRRDGRDLATIGRWRSAAKKLKGSARAWASLIERRLVMITDANSERRFKLRDGDGPIITEDEFVSSGVNLRLLDATPSLLTALGLIGTFVAIAIGLAGLVPDSKTETVQGVAALVAGLSGKFITSIVALTLSLVFQWMDAVLFRRLYHAQYSRFLAAVDEAIPTLSPAQQFAALLETSRKQETSLANISSDVVDKFSDIFSSSLLPQLGTVLAVSVQGELEPTLNRVVAGLDSLAEGIRSLETGKQESLGAEFRSLAQAIESSLRTTLEKMGTQFTESLSGSAGTEFDNASKALGASAEVLKGMNTSFEAMQTSLQRLLVDAEGRAAKAFDDGEGRTRALNELVERLVTQLGTSATSSAGEVQRLLVDAVGGLRGQFSQFAEDMERRVRESTAEGTANAQLVFEKTADAAQRTSAETEKVLLRIGERIEDFDRAAGQLRELREGVEHVLAETAARVRDMQEAAIAFRSVATEAATMTRSLRETQDQQRATAESAAGTVSRVGLVVQDQAKMLEATERTFGEASRVFTGLDQQLASALRVMIESMLTYNVQVEKNFESIMIKVNEKMPELFERLEGNLQVLSQAVEELQDTVKPGQRIVS